MGKGMEDEESVYGTSMFGLEVEAVPTPDQRFKPSSAMVGFPSANLKDLTSRSALNHRLPYP
jgi:hypothetical protein